MENIHRKNFDIDKGLFSTIGKTPLIPLKKIFEDIPFQLFAKLEMFNPGGSAKDRTALKIIKQGIEEGIIQHDTTIIESSSGNMGVALAQICGLCGLKFICVVDPEVTHQHIAILKAYGAIIDVVTEPNQEMGGFFYARFDRIQYLLQNTPNSFWPNQHANPNNPLAHYETMQEITEQLHGKVDYLFVAVSTFGTIRGCAEYVRKHNMNTQIIAVDAEGSKIFQNTPVSRRLITGYGASAPPSLYQSDIANKVIYTTDLDCVVGCHLLLKREAILAGGSSGAVLMALEKTKYQIPPDANCVVLLCDTGVRYLDTIYSDAWIEEHFGDVSSLW